MSDDAAHDSMRDRFTRQGEDALGKLAQDLLENSLINAVITRAFDAREMAAQAQEVAMGALNIPTASDIERLTRRVRSVSQRLEGIEDGVDRLEQRLESLAPGQAIADRLARIERQLTELSRELGALHESLPGGAAAPPREQERLTVGEG